MDDPKKLVYEKKKYLSDWLRNAKTIADAVPKVQQQLDAATWESSALSDAPKEIIAPWSEDLCSSLRKDLNIIQRALQPIPEIDPKIVNASIGCLAGTTSEIYMSLNMARQSDVVPIREWGIHHSEEYLFLQFRFKREGEVLEILNKFCPSLGKEFELASNDFRKFLAGTGNRTSAGIAMRNVLERFKGELFDHARKHLREQKLGWNEIADRLMDQGTSRDRFKRQGERWNSLQQRLSKLAKGRIGMDKEEVKSIFVELVDHLYITLTLAQLT